MTERDWRELRRAVRLGWFAYVILWCPFLVIVLAMTGGVLVDNFFFSQRDFPGTWKHLVDSGFFAWGLGSLVFLNVTIRSLDRAAKHKLARRIGLLPSHDA